MTNSAHAILRIAIPVAATLLIGFPAIWGAFALWFQSPGGQTVRVFATLLWAAFSIGVVITVWHGRSAAGVAVFVVMFAGLLWWWHGLKPTNDRPWADDVARISTATVDGNLVTVHDVRNFDWRTTTDYTQRWETRTYDLTRLNSVDMIMSYWTGPAIAHMLISFGFEDGEHVVFSVEVRRDKRKPYSELGGFFKDFELSIIAADERDVIRLRTNVRGEDDYLYRLRMPLSAMRSLFLGYVGEANSLTLTPRFYNTITVNCTTLVYHMMRRIVGHLPFDYRLLLSGYLPEYVYKVQGLDQRYSLDQLRSWGRITERAKQSDRSEHFSEDIRRGIPPIPIEDLPAGTAANGP